MPAAVTANSATAADGPSAPATAPTPVGRGVPGVPAGVVAWTTHPTTSTEPAKASRCCHRRKITSTAQAANRKMPKVGTEPSRLTAPTTAVKPAERSHHKQQDHDKPETRRPAQVLRQRRPRPGRTAADQPGTQTRHGRGP